jgi:hypothetical protein
MENRILIDDIIVLDRNLCQKIGIEQAFMLRLISEVAKRGEKVTQKFLSLESENFIKKPITVLNELKKKEIIENLDGEFIISTENLNKLLNEDTEEILELRKISKTVTNKKAEKIEQCVNWIMEELPFQSEILKDAVKEFVKYRIKKGLTEKACKLNAKKIAEYSGNDENYAIAVVEKTVSSGWQSFYDLNFNEKKKLEQNNLQSFSLTKNYEDDELTKKLKELGV